MDVIYTDRNLNDEGCLHHYNIDLDIANEKNFEITVGIKNNVMHLYADANGNISTSQSLYGVEEYVSTYENTSAESDEDLVSGGTERLQELIGADAFAVTSSDTEQHIGDIIGGYESVTDSYVISSITNIIVKLDDDTVDISYSVGDATRKG